LLGGATTWPLAARAQQTDKVRRIGFLAAGSESDAEWLGLVAAFKAALQNLGWTDGHNIRIETRWANHVDRLRAHAVELVEGKPDVIVAGGTSALSPLSQATQTIPIVFAQVGNPVRTGFVKSVARPGGNITGFAQFPDAIATKWLELLKEIAPGVNRVAAIYDQTNTGNLGQVSDTKGGSSIVRCASHCLPSARFG
jgi:putative ABC transport system substrate-binding protein